MTEIATGSKLAIKLQSVALFGESLRKRTFSKNLTGPAPKQSSAEMKAKGQSDPGYPIVQITDLSKGPGEQVSVDLFNIAKMRPTMGDRKLAGRMGQLTHSSMDVKINQTRSGIEAGGKMSQQRTTHNLRGISRANLSGWNARLFDQLTMVHFAGARGTQNDEEWVLPTAADPEFNDIVVNPVLPPTRNRRFFANDATSVANLDTGDKLALSDLDRLRALIDDMAFPMQPVILEGDPEAEENPLYVLYVSGRVWHHLSTSTASVSWRTFLAQAYERARNWKSHPLFNGSPGMWNGILVKKMHRAIRFAAGDTVVEYDASNVAQNVTAAVATDRCFLLGAQGLASCYGRHDESGYHVAWHEEKADHGNVTEISSSTMGGMAKVRFTGSDGAPTDHGVMTIDVYAPAVT